jgi:CheY-like chemotaxis protein
MVSPRRPAPSGDADLRARFIRAAREILREPDTPLDLRKVAERAEKSRTAPYLVFGKEKEGGGLLALRIAVAADGAREMAGRMEAAAREAAGGGDAQPVAVFRRVVRAFLAFVEENRRLFRLMYGPDINALAQLGQDGFTRHPEFARLLAERDRAGRLVARLIAQAQARGFAVRDPAPGSRAAALHEDPPSQRYLLVAWSTMIGVALLRDDELLRSIGWVIGGDEGADLVVAAVFGLDAGRMDAVAESFLATPSVQAELMAGLGAEAAIASDVPDALEYVAEDEEADEGADEDLGDDAVGDDDEGADDGALLYSAPAIPTWRRARPTPPSTWDLLEAYPGLRRAARSLPALSGARMLWIDDVPENVEPVVRTLERLGARVDHAHSTEEALGLLLKDADYAVILSDIYRGRDANAGVTALPALRDAAPDVPVVFFVADYDPERGVPRGAAGITNRVDELLQLVVDAVEGRRGA